MKTAGIVCEYNPFHRGHARLLREKEDRAAVCLMSGNYVQRGYPALFSKEVRTRAALLAGADLVLELPVTVCLASAEGFAGGAVRILSSLGVEELLFGSECGNPELLQATARVLLEPELGEFLRQELQSGLSFPAARARAAERLGADPSLLSRPNDILAVEYCKAILAQGSPLQPRVALRPGDYHAAEADRENPSATALRRLIYRNEPWLTYVPEASRPAYAGAAVHSLAAGERAVLTRLRTMTDAEFENLPCGSEGLWRKLMRESRRRATLEDILTAVKSKRYTRSRLDRMALCAFLGLTRRDLETPPPYVRILGFNDLGRQVLHQLRKQGVCLVHAGQHIRDPYFELETRCNRLYGLFALQTEAAEAKEKVVYVEA